MFSDSAASTFQGYVFNLGVPEVVLMVVYFALDCVVSAAVDRLLVLDSIVLFLY